LASQAEAYATFAGSLAFNPEQVWAGR
jgi:hypothetical protein